MKLLDFFHTLNESFAYSNGMYWVNPETGEVHTGFEDHGDFAQRGLGYGDQETEYNLSKMESGWEDEEEREEFRDWFESWVVERKKRGYSGDPEQYRDECILDALKDGWVRAEYEMSDVLDLEAMDVHMARKAARLILKPETTGINLSINGENHVGGMSATIPHHRIKTFLLSGKVLTEEILDQIETRHGVHIDFDYKDDSEPANRGWVVDMVRAMVAGEEVGYLKISYIPRERFEQFYPDVFHYLKRIEGKSLISADEHRHYSEWSTGELREALYRLSGYERGWNENLPRDRNTLLKLAQQAEHRYEKKFREFEAFHVDRPYVDFIRVDREWMRKGLGMALYEAGAKWMAHKGLRLYASGLQSDEAKAVWNQLEREGKVAQDGKRRYYSLNESGPYTRNNVYLKKYMQNPEVDYYQFWWKFEEWMEENEYDFDEEDIEATRKVFDEDDPESLEQMPEAVKKSFIEWCKTEGIEYLLRHDPSEAPTWAHASYNRFVPNQTWLIHFSDNAESIWKEGFKNGVDQIDKLGLTTYGGDFNRGPEGYAFAFIANSRDASFAASQGKYGRHAVLFQHGGVSIQHHGDEEEQIVFQGSDVDPRGMVLLVKEYGDWVVQGRNHRQFFRGDYPTVLKWVAQNHRQYARVLAGGR